MQLININIHAYFHMIPLWKSHIKLPVELQPTSALWEKLRFCWEVMSPDVRSCRVRAPAVEFKN